MVTYTSLNFTVPLACFLSISSDNNYSNVGTAHNHHIIQVSLLLFRLLASNKSFGKYLSLNLRCSPPNPPVPINPFKIHPQYSHHPITIGVVFCGRDFTLLKVNDTTSLTYFGKFHMIFFSVISHWWLQSAAKIEKRTSDPPDPYTQLLNADLWSVASLGLCDIFSDLFYST